MSEKTLFQKIVDREIPAEIVYEDDRVIAFKDIQPQAPIHVLIVPKKPIPRVGESEESDEGVLGRLLYVSRLIAEKLGVVGIDQGYRLVINHGANAGEAVPHLHVHFLAGRSLTWPPG